MQSLLGVWLTGIYLAGLPPAGLLQQPEQTLDRYEFLQIQMGVPFKIVLYASGEAAANRAARNAYRRIKQLDGILSDYNPDSELMRLCRLSGPDKPVTVSRELQFVLSRSLELSRKTGGAFDVTVGPVVKLWRIARRRKKLPGPDTLAAALNSVGYQHVRLDENAGTVRLMKPGMQLDFGGIAKGYAGDEALTVLKKHGITRALVDGSGDVVVGDPPPGQTGWRIGIAELSSRKDQSSNPVFQINRVAKPMPFQPNRFLLLKNAAVATSGDAYQFVEIDGKRYSHIVNPATGLGLMRRSSVTVIAPNGVTADSLASAVSVLGPKRGLKLIDDTKKAAALIIRETRGGTPQSFSSKRLAEFEIGDKKGERTKKRRTKQRVLTPFLF